MLSDARQKYIKDLAFKNGEVIISDLAKELGVSLETVRRDINYLSSQGYLEKVHGGAIPVVFNPKGNKCSERISMNEPLKRKLGTFVSNIIRGCSTVFLSTGTALETVKISGRNSNAVSIITNSLPLAETVGKLAVENPKVNVYLLGGNLNSDERYTYGSAAILDIRKYHADAVIISAAGIDESGAMCASADEGTVIAEMINSSAKVILMADSSKFGKKAAFRHCTLEKIDRIVTDDKSPIPDTILKAIKKKNIRIDIV